jgi:hypothetical protein
VYWNTAIVLVLQQSESIARLTTEAFLTGLVEEVLLVAGIWNKSRTTPNQTFAITYRWLDAEQPMLMDEFFLIVVGYANALR